MVIQLNGGLFGLTSSTRDFKIGQARLEVDFKSPVQTKLHNTKFNYHFITATLKSQKSLSTDILLTQQAVSGADPGFF